MFNPNPESGFLDSTVTSGSFLQLSKAHLGTPNAQWFVADGVEDGKKSGLVGVPEHFKELLIGVWKE